MVYRAAAQLLHHVHFKAITEGYGLVLGNRNRPDEVQQTFLCPLKFKAPGYIFPSKTVR